MKFIDTAVIEVKAGDGGNGHISFRREKFVDKGGPDGGDGGNGGDVVVVGNRHLATLLDFKYQRKYKAEHGKPGGKNLRTGKSGANAVINVPLGTVIRNASTGEQICDVEHDGEEFVVAQGGKGGRGNETFKSATHQAPRYAEDGKPGEEFELELELKLLADVGLVGLPNAGKSTLISVMSAAKPKIAEYPFTTLVPNLGMVRVGEAKSFTMADIPGLIEGAHEGKGLGHQFLRHVERTAVLVFMIDSASDNPKADLELLRHELGSYDPAMLRKPSVVCLTKVDTLGNEALQALEQDSFTVSHQARCISAVAGVGIQSLTQELWGFVDVARQAP